MSLEAGSKSKWQQTKRPREEHLRYIYYCFGFSRYVKKRVHLLSICVCLARMGGDRKYWDILSRVCISC